MAGKLHRQGQRTSLAEEGLEEQENSLQDYGSNLPINYATRWKSHLGPNKDFLHGDKRHLRHPSTKLHKRQSAVQKNAREWNHPPAANTRSARHERPAMDQMIVDSGASHTVCHNEAAFDDRDEEPSEGQIGKASHGWWQKQGEEDAVGALVWRHSPSERAQS